MSDPLITDADGLTQLAVSYMEVTDPDWEASPGDPLSRAFSAIAVIVSYLLGVVQDAIVQDIVPTVGAIILQTPLFSATPATVSSTWTAIDINGPYDIPAGTQVALLDSDGLPVAFEVSETVTIANGVTTTDPGEVLLVALESGTAGNDLGGTVAQIGDSGSLAFIVSVATVGNTSGGVDAETFDDYGVRIQKIAKLVKVSTVLPEDFALAATVLVQGVGRAVAIDLYNADTDTTGEERCITVVPAQLDGSDVDPDVATDVDDLLESLREDNFEVFVKDPTRTAIAVNYVATPADGVDDATAKTAADAALEAFFDPGTWGASAKDATIWIERPIVRFQDVSAALVDVAQIDHWTTLTINGATADIALSGPGGKLPDATITGTVA